MDTFVANRPLAKRSCASVEIVSSEALTGQLHWRRAFASHRKDHRYFELLEETLREGYDYRYFLIRGSDGDIRAVQPFFLVDQSVLAGTELEDGLVAAIRRIWPGFFITRMLMMGCVSGEGHLDTSSGFRVMPLLASRICGLARALGAQLIVLKEFGADYRGELRCFEEAGFKRVPSLPMTRLDIDCDSFEDYLKRLGPRTRRTIRRKLRIADRAEPPIHMQVTRDVSDVIDEVYPLYLKVYERGKMKFERLTPAFLCELGRRMPDRTRFFLWRQDGRIVAFALCMVHGDSVFGEYLGFDYNVAYDLHLYYVVTRGVINWAAANGYKRFRSGGQSYDPKLHLRHALEPLDLYVRHVNPAINLLLKAAAPYLEPTRNDPLLKKFANYKDLWRSPPPKVLPWRRP